MDLRLFSHEPLQMPFEIRLARSDYPLANVELLSEGARPEVPGNNRITAARYFERWCKPQGHGRPYRDKEGVEGIMSRTER